MRLIEDFAALADLSTVSDWRERVFELGQDLGYERTLLAIFPDREAPVEAEYAFLHSNYSSRWRNKYDEEKMGHVDPTVAHCVTKSIPLIWSPDIFAAQKQRDMYEEACCFGLKSGVTLPIHGAKGELGVLCFVSDTQPDSRFAKEVQRNIPALSCLRDFVFDSAGIFMAQQNLSVEKIRLTPRELECMKWSAIGKSSWEIAQIQNCTESAVNFHFSNVRKKFGTTTRRQALVKAIRLGIINPS